MSRKEKKYHYIYKTTCLITNRFYIGMHSTFHINDDYLGSGTRLRRSIRKHGKENHIKEIIEYCETRILLIEREKELINEDILKNSLCMNLKPGGEGGFNNKEHQLKCSIAGTNTPGRTIKSSNTLRNKLKDLEYKENYSNTIKKGLENIKFNFKTFENKNHTEESKRKIGEKNSINQKGENNSQFGTCWITNGKENKKIKKEEINSYLCNGWCKGRK